MTLIKHESVEAVKEAVDMIDLVSGRTQMKRSGAEWRGRCPFHDERTGSFWVDPIKKVYYCFGCQAKGDAIRFVQETEALDFAGSVEWLADRYAVTLEYEESSPDADRRRAERERLLKLLDTAASFYQRFLWDAVGRRRRAATSSSAGSRARAPIGSAWDTRPRLPTASRRRRWPASSRSPSYHRRAWRRAEVTGSGSG